MTALRQRQPRQKDEKFLRFLRQQRCCVCSHAPPVHAAHIRMGSIEHNKRPTGMGERPDDRWSLPVCVVCHLDGNGSIHRMGEEAFWANKTDPFQLAIALYERFIRL